MDDDQHPYIEPTPGLRTAGVLLGYGLGAAAVCNALAAELGLSAGQSAAAVEAALRCRDRDR